MMMTQPKKGRWLLLPYFIYHASIQYALADHRQQLHNYAREARGMCRKSLELIKNLSLSLAVINKPRRSVGRWQ